MNTVCINCQTHFKGRYCPQCAQKASTGRIKVHTIVHEFWHNFTHTDKGFPALALALFTKPGTVIREYIAGKRKKYFNPFTYYLVVTAVLIYITNKVFHYEDERYHLNNEFGQYLGKNYNIILFCCIPVLAGFFQLVFLRRRYNYAEWLVFFIFGFSALNTLEIIIQLLYFPLIAYHYEMKGWTEAVSYLLLTCILFDFIRPRNFWGIFRCVLCGVLVYYFVEYVANVVALLLAGVPFKALF